MSREIKPPRGLHRVRGSPFWWMSLSLPGGRRVQKSTKTTLLTEARAILERARVEARKNEESDKSDPVLAELLKSGREAIERKIAATMRRKIISDVASKYRAPECEICGETVDMSVRFPNRMAPQVDHIVPISDGGKSVPGNLRIVHAACNQSRNKKAREEDQRAEEKDAQEPDGRLLLPINDVARLLCISSSHVRRLIWTGELTSVRIRRSIRVERSAVMSFIDKCRIPSAT